MAGASLIKYSLIMAITYSQVEEKVSQFLTTLSADKLEELAKATGLYSRQLLAIRAKLVQIIMLEIAAALPGEYQPESLPSLVTYAYKQCLK